MAVVRKDPPDRSTRGSSLDPADVNAMGKLVLEGWAGIDETWDNQGKAASQAQRWKAWLAKASPGETLITRVWKETEEPEAWTFAITVKHKEGPETRT